MFGHPNPQKTKRAVQPSGNLTPAAIPFQGMNARSPFAVMGPEYGITLTNVVSETYGLRTRRGYTEYATGLPEVGPVPTIMAYYPASSTPDPVATGSPPASSLATLMFFTRNTNPLVAQPPGKLFAVQGGKVFDVTIPGNVTRTEAAGILAGTDYWNYINYQNSAGAFLCATCETGGYFVYDGTTWTRIVAGAAAGQIDGCDPDKFAFIISWKKRIWFIEKNSTRAWYLPVDQITGTVKPFDFGNQLSHGGALASLASWTVDGGDGMDDHLVGVGYQGDVVIYKGVDPDDPDNFLIHGTWFCGPLPLGRRQVSQSGGDVFILSQLGVMPVSKLLTATSLSAEVQQHISYLIDPLVASLMRSYAEDLGWQEFIASKDEMVLIGIPTRARVPFGGSYLAYKTTTKSWSLLTETNYASFVEVGPVTYAGTLDGRIVLAFDGPLDNVTPNNPDGLGIKCQVTPAYQPMGNPGVQKRFTMVRPSFLTANLPSVKVTLLTDYRTPGYGTYPSLPVTTEDEWDLSNWNIATWGGLKNPVREWVGISGAGFAATVQLDYTAGGDTLLTSIDFWSEQGGPL